ncbi:MAG: group II intron reverse transcriptase/maturase [Candidatus Competibacteraceae bacterium]|nr:group II intron reverse transcriptase/maturase [Candidatus Competibacteraceae bacterium]
MQTTLQAIANKAKRDKRYRFRNLYMLLNQENLVDTYRFLKRNAAPGVDRKTARSYGSNLARNVRRLTTSLREKRYRPSPVKRVYIPKANGKLRPLGLPTTEDKLVQATAARILNAIYEQDFLDSSHGYRPGRSARSAAEILREQLQKGWFGYVLEADIQGFFDTIDHDWLIRMVEQRVDDRAFLRLIRKWLKAGILETDMRMVAPETGTPQGGVISPVLANIYLHYALDLWFEKVKKPACKGQACLIRYADDFVCAFQHRDDARGFFAALPDRLGKFGLRLALDKTRVLKFTRFDKERSGSFDFLGFEYRWIRTRTGKDAIRCRTARKKFRSALKSLKEWCKESRKTRLREFFPILRLKLRGHYQYFGIRGNSDGLVEFYRQANRLVYKWLNRRSQRRSFSWSFYFQLLKRHAITRPRMKPRPPIDLQYQFSFA